MDTTLKSSHVPIDYAKGLLRLAAAFETTRQSIPGLEVELPEITEDMKASPPPKEVRPSKILGQKRREAGAAKSEDKKTDSNMIFPIFLVGAVVFLLSR